jgi:hypothetical protein
MARDRPRLRHIAPLFSPRKEKLPVHGATCCVTFWTEESAINTRYTRKTRMRKSSRSASREVFPGLAARRFPASKLFVHPFSLAALETTIWERRSKYILIVAENNVKLHTYK